MGTPNISLPIDKNLQQRIQADVKRTGLSRADVVRIILRKHYGIHSDLIKVPS